MLMADCLSLEIRRLHLKLRYLKTKILPEGVEGEVSLQPVGGRYGEQALAHLQAFAHATPPAWNSFSPFLAPITGQLLLAL